jgi:hypothetical protein
VARPQTRTRRIYVKAPTAKRRFTSRIRGAGAKIAGIVPTKVIPAAVGAAGALALDMGWGYLPIPASLATGPLAPVARIAGALALGYAAKFVAGDKYAEEVTVGAITVTVYDLAKTWMQANVPSVPLSAYVGGMGYYSPARFSPMGVFVDGGSADDGGDCDPSY